MMLYTLTIKWFFPQFINQLKEKHFNKNKIRDDISQEIKQILLKQQKNKCNVCKDELKNMSVII